MSTAKIDTMQALRLKLRERHGAYAFKPKELPPVTTTSPIYFWRGIDSDTAFLSMWFPSPFRDVHDPAKIYPTAEHYLCHHRALLFGDEETAAAILATGSPHRAKELVRRVENFDDAVWHAERGRIAADANWYKFTRPIIDSSSPLLPRGYPWQSQHMSETAKLQARDLKKALLDTGEHRLVLGHPMDRYWGIGQAKGRAWPRREKWGLNMMGICLMELREKLRTEEAGSQAVDELTLSGISFFSC
ncbi:hypothetical protein F5Y05DRAFT_413801 [Hypoxylon sp. FL0543]|nr:hypothetical protein F5Y05DRAFT_413801 [Hypoxylon sp. FL0543]